MDQPIMRFSQIQSLRMIGLSLQPLALINRAILNYYNKIRVSDQIKDSKL